MNTEDSADIKLKQRNLLIFQLQIQLRHLQVQSLSSAMHFQLHPNMAPECLYIWSDRSSASLSHQEIDGSGQSTSFGMVPGQEKHQALRNTIRNSSSLVKVSDFKSYSL